MIARGSHFRVRFGWTGWQDKGLTALPSIKDCSASPPSPPPQPSCRTDQLSSFHVNFQLNQLFKHQLFHNWNKPTPVINVPNCLKASFQDVQLDNCLLACSITLQRLDHLDLVVQLHFEMLSKLGSASGSYYTFYMFLSFKGFLQNHLSVCLLINGISQFAKKQTLWCRKFSKAQWELERKILMHLVAKIFSLGHLFDKAVQSYKELGANQQERPKEDIVKSSRVINQWR